jgi:hypothetical protein
MPEIVELIEEFEALRTGCGGLFRGGRAGDGCDAFRLGRGGGTLRVGSGEVFAFPALEGRGLSLSMGGGGNRFPFTPIGRLFDGFVTEEPC